MYLLTKYTKCFPTCVRVWQGGLLEG